MTRNNDRDDLTGSLGDPSRARPDLSTVPSAHHGPPARALGTSASADATGTDDPLTGTVRPAGRRPRALDADPVSYDTVSPRTGRASRGAATKWAFGGVAVVALAIGYFLLPKFGFGPGNGKGGTGPGNGGASPNPPAVTQAPPAPLLSNPQPAKAPTSPPTTGPLVAPPTGPLHLTIQNKSIHLGGADGPVITVEEAAERAKGTKSDQPVMVDMTGTSRARLEEQLKAAFERQQTPVVWTEDGKPVTGDLPGTHAEPPQP